MGPEDTLGAYGARINDHDFDQLVPLIAGDAVFWFNDGSFRGLDEIRAAFEKTWQSFPLERYWLEDIEWIARGEAAAAAIYHFRWRAMVEARPVLGGGRGSTVLRNGDGGWKIVHEHLSQHPP